MNEGASLRFGIMCRGTTFPAWQARCIRDLMALEGVEPALLILNDNPTPAPSLSAKVLRRPGRRDLMWAAYKRMFVTGRSAAMRPADLSAELAGLPAIRCRTTTRERHVDRFGADDVSRIRSHGLDFILRFTFGIIHGDVLSAARYGVWSFHHGDEQRYRGGPPCFWEMYKADRVTGAILQRLTERLDGGIVLHKGFFRTVPHSYVRSRDAVYMGSADWPARVCKDIRNGAATYFDNHPSSSRAPAYRNPSARQTLVFVGRWARSYVRAQIRARSRRNEWNVGIVNAPIASFLRRNGQRPVRWLPTRSGPLSLADPFPIPTEDGLVLLAEDYDHRARRGRISLVEARPDGSASLPRAVLDLSVHASYPFLFVDEDAVYCVPETARAREIGLFRCTGDVGGWEKVATLVEGFAGLDPTVFRHEGLWWLFCTDRDRGPDTKLHAWFASELRGSWSPHALNPLKTDVRSSRPAGTPFIHEGRLYRPAQDGSRAYGGRVVVNEVIRLSPVEFEELPVATVEPDRQGPWPDGLHTLSAAGRYTLIDGKRSRFVWSPFAHSAKGQGAGVSD